MMMTFLCLTATALFSSCEPKHDQSPAASGTHSLEAEPERQAQPANQGTAEHAEALHTKNLRFEEDSPSTQNSQNIKPLQSAESLPTPQPLEPQQPQKSQLNTQKKKLFLETTTPDKVKAPPDNTSESPSNTQKNSFVNLNHPIQFYESCHFNQKFNLEITSGAQVDQDSITLEAFGSSVQSVDLTSEGFSIVLNPETIKDQETLSILLAYSISSVDSQAQTANADQNNEQKVNQVSNTKYRVRQSDHVIVRPEFMSHAYNGTGIEPKSIETCVVEGKSRASMAIAGNSLCGITRDQKVTCHELNVDGSQSTNNVTQTLNWDSEDPIQHIKATESAMCLKGSGGSLSCYSNLLPQSGVGLTQEKTSGRKWNALIQNYEAYLGQIAAFALYGDELCAVFDGREDVIACMGLGPLKNTTAETLFKPSPSSDENHQTENRKLLSEFHLPANRQGNEDTRITKIGMNQNEICGITDIGGLYCTQRPALQQGSSSALKQRPLPKPSEILDIALGESSQCLLFQSGTVECDSHAMTGHQPNKSRSQNQERAQIQELPQRYTPRLDSKALQLTISSYREQETDTKISQENDRLIEVFCALLQNYNVVCWNSTNPSLVYPFNDKRLRMFTAQGNLACGLEEKGGVGCFSFSELFQKNVSPDNFKVSTLKKNFRQIDSVFIVEKVSEARDQSE